MKFTTHLELHSQTTRLVEGPPPGRRQPAWHGILTLCDVLFQGTWASAPPRRCLSKLQLGGRGTPDFKFELLPLHSPLLGQSLLVSFPPLIDMLKFSGYPYLIRGVPMSRSPRPTQGPGAGCPAALERQCVISRSGTQQAVRPWIPARWPPARGTPPPPSPRVQSREQSSRRRSNRHAPRNARGRNVRSKIR